MSDTPQGADWWRAADGNWYPPEQWTGPPGTTPPLNTAYQSPARPAWGPPQNGPATTVETMTMRLQQPWYRRLPALLAAGTFLFVAGCTVGAAANGAPDQVEQEDASATTKLDCPGGQVSSDKGCIRKPSKAATTTAPPTTAAPTTAAPTTPPPTTAPPPTTPPPTAPPIPVSQTNAVRKAENYLDFSAFSRSGLIAQLEYEGFSNADATYAVDTVRVDWNEQAAKKAASYLEFSAFSRQGLLDQLLYEGFTPAQAEHGVNSTGL